MFLHVLTNIHRYKKDKSLHKDKRLRTLEASRCTEGGKRGKSIPPLYILVLEIKKLVALLFLVAIFLCKGGGTLPQNS